MKSLGSRFIIMGVSQFTSIWAGKTAIIWGCPLAPARPEYITNYNNYIIVGTKSDFSK